jgi:hypothetical protein
MQFVIIGINGKPICDDAGIPMVLPSRDDALRWIIHGETVLPYVATRRGLSSLQSADLGQAANRALTNEAPTNPPSVRDLLAKKDPTPLRAGDS